MGISLRGLSLWQFHACLDGYIAAQSGEEEPPGIDEDEYAEMLAKQL